jgi:hypothetical protein
MAVGCGSGNNADTANSESKGESDARAESNASKLADTSTAEKAVQQFLEAFKAGNDAKAEALLSTLAQKKTKEAGLQVAPKGSDTAQFEIGRVQYLKQDGNVADGMDDSAVGARVATTCSDIGKDGDRRKDEVVWVLRKESDGWRIAGMAAVVIPGRDPILLDFEDPEETQLKIEKAKRELAKETAPNTESSTAQNERQPASPANGSQDDGRVAQPGVGGRTDAAPAAENSAKAEAHPPTQAENAPDSVRR